MLDSVARLDDLPRRAAAVDPGGTAIRTDRGELLDFAELDRRVDRCAERVRSLVGGPGRIVAIASVLSPAFAVAYYGTLRAGNVVVPVIPLLREEGIAHLLAASGAELVIAPAALAGRLPAGVPVLGLDGEELWDAPPLRSAPPVQPDDVATIHFTSGTTGAPKGVRQTHDNLAVNAAQTVWAHGLVSGSVTVNHLPTYHPMHLNSALHAGATQVLCTDPDLAASVHTANAARANVYYSLPMRLSRLAADPVLPGLRLKTVRAVFSGGSALPVSATRALSDQFGIPVLQGYGLAETSPMTHCDRPHRPKPGSCGPTVPGAECRIVDLVTRKLLEPGTRGEIQVRGPQLMRGYLGESDGSALDDEGWFNTGDVGYLDSDGYLFVVDRLKDVFKCDNWLVSPNEVERVLLGHPAVADCVVVDCPDRFSGAVAGALVVPKGVTGQSALEAIAAQVNEELPYFQRIRHIREVTEITRTGSGKVRRTELREFLQDLLTQ
ncbi:class I adenylate-forming enzyme family protein [Streptomyces sp. NPDC057257]|uniref:class I adenylate-forming enzyme family protein n=1 Tax=Streptomyces sp. NPDC057257 TaxID=3346071 RepID=UPI00363E5D4C